MRRQLVINGLLGALALGTLGVVWVTRETPTTAQLAERKGKLLPVFRKDAVSRLTLSQDGQELELVPSKLPGEAGEFRIVKPWPERADIATVNQLLGALDMASELRGADEVSKEQAGLNEQALRLRIETGGKAQIITLGGAAPAPAGARYAEVTSDGATHRYVVSAGVATELSPSFDKFREPRLLDSGKSEIAKLELVQGGQKLTLTQAEHGAFFVDVAGGRELASRDVTERVFNALSRLSTTHFVEADVARKALREDALRVTLSLIDKTAPPIQLTFGSCLNEPGEALALKEQAGKGARAGCVSAELESALRVTGDDARLQGPFAARPDEVEELRIVRGTEKLELARKDKAFVLRSANGAEVALDAGNARISAIVDAKGERATSHDPSAWGLSPAAGELSIQIAGADEGAHRAETVALGTPRGDGSVCLKRNADAVVLCFSAQVARAFEPDATLLKGLRLLGFAPSELSSFSVEADGLRELVSRHDDGSYELTEPKGFRHDGSVVADAVQTLGTLQAVRWERADNEEILGLATPRVHIRLELIDHTVHDLHVGAPASDGYYARLTPDPGVFVLARSVVRELSTPLIERSLCPIAESELVELRLVSRDRSLTLTRRADAWTSSTITATRARELVEAVTALRAELAVHLGAARPREGLANPALTVSGTSANGKHYRLTLGARATLDDSPIVYARLDGVDATFALSARIAEDLQNF
jgi:uncharacterized protein DUF4340